MFRLQDVYADLSGNVLLHSSIPALGLRASQWAVISWARPADATSFADSKFSYKCVSTGFEGAVRVVLDPAHTPYPTPVPVPNLKLRPMRLTLRNVPLPSVRARSTLLCLRSPVSRPKLVSSLERCVRS